MSIDCDWMLCAGTCSYKERILITRCTKRKETEIIPDAGGWPFAFPPSVPSYRREFEEEGSYHAWKGNRVCENSFFFFFKAYLVTIIQASDSPSRSHFIPDFYTASSTRSARLG